MKLEDFMNDQYLDAMSYHRSFTSALPFSHIVLKNFLKIDLLRAVADEFPHRDALQKRSSVEIERASTGMRTLTPSAIFLNTYLQSEIMLDWLSALTGIEETLISDPYLVGGGYHESRRGDLLKVHADFNKHPQLNLDRRLNLLIYLNDPWDDNWGGALQLFDQTISPRQTILPRFNTAVIFATTSHSYHGFPDPIQCPEDSSRKSLAYYYYTNGRPGAELSLGEHGTLWKERNGEKFKKNTPLSASEKFNRRNTLVAVARDFMPPALYRLLKKISRALNVLR